jgi:hypothetical protein
VKTISTGDWPTDAKKHLQVEFDAETEVQRVVGLQPLPDPDTVMVFARLRESDAERDRFFILTRRTFQAIVKTHYEAFLARHSGRRPQTPESYAVRIRLHEMEPYEDKWEIVEAQLGRASLAIET